MKFDDLTPEQKEKAKGLKTPEEILEFVKAEGFELEDEQLDKIAGAVVLPGTQPGDSKFIWED